MNPWPENETILITCLAVAMCMYSTLLHSVIFGQRASFFLSIILFAIHRYAMDT